MNPVYYWLLESEPKKWPLKKVQILEAFIKMIANEGAENLSPETLAKSMGMARSHIVYYFKTKELLFEEALGFISTSAQLITLKKCEAYPEHQKLEAIIDGAFDWAKELPDHAVAFALLQYFAAHKPEYRERFNVIRATGRERIAAALKLRKKLSPARLRSASLHVQLLLSTYITEAFTTDVFESLDEAQKSCFREIDLYLST